MVVIQFILAGVTLFLLAVLTTLVVHIVRENDKLRGERQEMWQYFMTYKATQEGNYEGARLMTALQREKLKKETPSAGAPEKAPTSGMTLIEGENK